MYVIPVIIMQAVYSIGNKPTDMVYGWFILPAYISRQEIYCERHDNVRLMDDSAAKSNYQRVCPLCQGKFIMRIK